MTSGVCKYDKRLDFHRRNQMPALMFTYNWAIIFRDDSIDAKICFWLAKSRNPLLWFVWCDHPSWDRFRAVLLGLLVDCFRIVRSNFLSPIESLSSSRGLISAIFELHVQCILEDPRKVKFQDNLSNLSIRWKQCFLVSCDAILSSFFD